MTASPEFDALMATTQLEREKADGIRSLVSSAKATAKWQHRAEVAEAALARVEALHVRGGNDPDPDTEWCAECEFGWPCSTIRALTEWNA